MEEFLEIFCNVLHLLCFIILLKRNLKNVFKTKVAVRLQRELVGIGKTHT